MHITLTDEVKGGAEAEGRAVRFDNQKGKVFANLRIRADVAGAVALKANEAINARGSLLVGKGFLGTKAELLKMAEGTDAVEKRVVRPFLGGYDFSQRHRRRWVIDFWGLSESQAKSAMGSFTNIF